MNAGLRRAVAYIAGRMVAGSNSTHVYDYDSSKHFSFSGNADATKCNIYDHDRRCHVTGAPPSLYDYGNQKHLTLDVKGTEFSGYDYASGKHFSGRVNGNSIFLYDYDGSGHHNYSV